MAHTLICHTNSLKENQEKAKRNVFKFHLFIPHTFYLQSQICSELRRDKKYKKDQRFGFGGLLGVRFKFVISHVQVNIKMLLVHCFCRQHRFGAGQTPCSLLNFLKRGLEIGRPACSSMQFPLHWIFFSSSLPSQFINSWEEGRATVGVCHLVPLLCYVWRVISYRHSSLSFLWLLLRLTVLFI